MRTPETFQDNFIQITIIFAFPPGNNREKSPPNSHDKFQNTPQTIEIFATDQTLLDAKSYNKSQMAVDTKISRY